MCVQRLKMMGGDYSLVAVMELESGKCAFARARTCAAGGVGSHSRRTENLCFIDDKMLNVLL
jgi:hypothetical protein